MSILRLLCFVIFTFSYWAPSQSSYTDSLDQIINQAADKSKSFEEISNSESLSQSSSFIKWAKELEKRIHSWEKVDQANYHLQLSSYYVYKANDDSIKYHFDKGKKLFEQANYPLGIAKLFGYLGKRQILAGNYQNAQAYLDSGKVILPNDTSNTRLFLEYYTAINWYRLHQLDSALKYYEKVINLGGAIGAKDLVMKAQVNSGVVYKNQGKYYQAQALLIKACEEFPQDDHISLTAIKLNLMSICLILDDYSNYKKFSQQVSEHLKTRPEKVSQTYYCQSLANYYREIEQMDSAIVKFKEGLEISEEARYDDRYMEILSELIEIYALQNDVDNFNQYAQIFEDKKADNHVYNGLRKVGHGYLLMNRYEEAKAYLLEALKAIEAANDTEELIDVYHYLGQVYDGLQDDSKSLFYYKKYTVLNDSISSDQITTKMADLQVLYETQKTKDQLNQAIQAKQISDQLNEEEQARKNTLIISIVVILVLVTLFTIKLLQLNRRGKLKNKQLKEAQKIISHKNEQINSSIEYAQTIQSALLPSIDTWKKHFPQSFVFFEPKDIVGGDYYWVHKNDDGKVFWATIDCTGHGVPGGFMTIIAHSLLNKVIVDQKTERTDEILFRLDLELKRLFNDDDRFDHNFSEGMDMSICCYDPITQTV